MVNNTDNDNEHEPCNTSLNDLIEEGGSSDLLSSTISTELQEETRKDNNFIEIIGVWKEEKKSEQTIKSMICFVALGLMIYQIIKINGIVIEIGKGTYKLDEWTLRLLIVGVFAEVVAVVKIIVENLFPKNGSKDFLEFLSKLQK